MTEHAESELLALYLRLYLDEDVSHNIEQNLVQRGFDKLGARTAGHLSLDDESQLAFAIDQGRVLVTHNRYHFELLHQQYLSETKTHCGIIIAKRRPDDSVVVRKLLALFNQVTSDEMRNQLRYI